MRRYYNATDIDIYIYIYSIDVVCFMSFVIKYLYQFEVVRLHDAVKKIREISIHKWVKDRGNISANDVIYLIFVSIAYSYMTDIHLDM